MAEEPLPDWLVSMRGQAPEDAPSAGADEASSMPPSPPPFSTSPDEGLPFVEEPSVEEPSVEEPAEEESQPGQFSELFADLQPADSDADMLGDLREQMVQPGEDYFEYDTGEGFSLSNLNLPSPIPGLKPWQSLIIAVLFFFDIALCGCMILVMAGRMMPSL